MTPRSPGSPASRTASSKDPAGKKSAQGATAAAAPPADFHRSVHDLVFAPRGDVFRSPEDWRDQVLYELMIDRFDDNTGRPMYEPPKAARTVPAKSSAAAAAATTPPPQRDAKQGAVFQGGKLKGITRRLDYIRGLGCTAIWITSPLKNRPGDESSYHGYGAQDFLRVDPRFGTLQDLQELVRAAHDRGMYVIQDIVFDHCGDVWAYEDDEERVWDHGRRYPFGFWRKGYSDGPVEGEPGPDDAIWPIELQHPDSFKRMGRMRDVGASRGDEAVDGDFERMKVLDLENRDVMTAMIHIYRYWIAATDVDGYRLDAARHVRPEAMKDFSQGIREYAQSIGKKNFLLIGEVAGDNDLMIKYVGNNAPLPEEHGHANHPLLDATLDFELYKVLPWAIKGRRSPEDLRARFDFLRRYYRDMGRAGENYVTFFENHDGGQGDRYRLLHGGVDPKLAVLASAFLLTSLGIPCLYYGTEQGFDGGGREADVYIREAMFGGNWGAFGTTGMHFFNAEHPVYKEIARVGAVRKEIPALRYGRQYMREMSVDGITFFHPWDGKCTLAWSRMLDTEEVVVAMNLTQERRTDCIMVDAKVTPKGTVMTDVLGHLPPLIVEARPDGWAYVRVPLEGYAMAILRAANRTAGAGPRPAEALGARSQARDTAAG